MGEQGTFIGADIFFVVILRFPFAKPGHDGANNKAFKLLIRIIDKVLELLC